MSKGREGGLTKRFPDQKRTLYFNVVKLWHGALFKVLTSLTVNTVAHGV